MWIAAGVVGLELRILVQVRHEGIKGARLVNLKKMNKQINEGDFKKSRISS
jgi:hypothetical protein